MRSRCLLVAIALVASSAPSSAAESPLTASDKPVGSPIIVVRRFEGLRLDECLARLQPLESKPREGTVEEKPQIIGYECLLQPAMVPAGIALPLTGGAKALGIQLPPEQKGPKALCQIEIDLAPDGARGRAMRNGRVARAFTDKDAKRCLEEFWTEHSIEKRTLELPLLLVPPKK